MSAAQLATEAGWPAPPPKAGSAVLTSIFLSSVGSPTVMRDALNPHTDRMFHVRGTPMGVTLVSTRMCRGMVSVSDYRRLLCLGMVLLQCMLVIRSRS